MNLPVIALPLGFVAWLGTTAVLARQRTVFGAAKYGALAVAVLIVLLPLGFGATATSRSASAPS